MSTRTETETDSATGATGTTKPMHTTIALSTQENHE